MYYYASYIFVLIAALISGIASMNVKSTYKKYSRMRSASGMTGAQVAERMLREAGISDVRVHRMDGVNDLNDFYSPTDKVLKLSAGVYDSDSVAAIGVAAHECGHAIQDQEQYMPLKLRSISVPVANIGSRLSWPILILGVILGYYQLAQVGIACFLLVVFFQLVTLPVEFNASARALQILESDRILMDQEMDASRKVLRAAAMTYVAALFTTIMQLVRMILISRGGDRRRR